MADRLRVWFRRAKRVWPLQAIGQIPKMGHVSQTRAQGKAVSPCPGRVLRAKFSPPNQTSGP